MSERENNSLTFKLVYYGPAQSGKTTNLLRLHDLLAPELKGELMTMETQDDRTLFFDLLPLGFRAPSGLLIKFRLFTVPGQIAHDGTRKAVLSRADGGVFVAGDHEPHAHERPLRAAAWPDPHVVVHERSDARVHAHDGDGAAPLWAGEDGSGF